MSTGLLHGIRLIPLFITPAVQFDRSELHLGL